MTADGEQHKEAVSVAFELVAPSYDWGLHRITSTEQRVDSIMGFSMALMVAVPLGVASLSRALSPTEGLSSLTEGNATIPGALALGLFLVVLGLGLWVRQKGNVLLGNPQKLLSEREHYSATAIKQEMVEAAGRALKSNIALVKSRSRWAVVMSVLGCFQLLSALTWGYFVLTSVRSAQLGTGL